MEFSFYRQGVMMKNLLAGSLVLSLLIVPFLTSALNEQSPFEFIKLFVLSNLTLVVFATVLVDMVRKPKIELRWNTGLSLVSVILAANTVSFLFSNNPVNSFWADINVPTDSLLTIIVFFLFSFCCVQLFLSEKYIQVFSVALIVMATAMGAYGIVQHFGLDPVDWWGYSHMATNAYATIGQAVGFGMIVGSVVPLTVMTYLARSSILEKSLLLLAFFIMMLGILYSGSRLPFIGTLFVTATGLAVYFFRNRGLKAYKNIGAVLLVTALAQGIYFFEDRTTGLGEKLTGESIGKGFGERTYIWEDALIIWKKYPIFGAGPETFGTEQKIVNRKEHNQFQNWELLWTKAHNHYIHHLATTGIVGLAAELLLLFFFIFEFFKSLRADKETDYTGAGLFLGFLFLSVNYMTAFNFVITQLCSYLFPTLYFLRRKTQTIEIKFPRFVNIAVAGVCVFLTGSLMVSLYKYWKADVLFGQAKREFLLNKNPEKAINAIDQAIMLQSYNPRLYCRKGTIVAAMLASGRNRYSQEQTDAAVGLVDNLTSQCVILDPSNAENISIRAKIMAELFVNRLIDSPAASIEGFREAAKVNPNNPTYYYRLGALYLNSNQPEEYIKNMRQAIELKADYLPAYTDLMGFFYRRGDRKEVDEIVQRVAKLTIDKQEFVAEIGNMINLAELNKDQQSKGILINVYMGLKKSGLIR
jgi:O-antigen ligase